MRIGVDVLAMQSPGSRGRGVGRFARGLLDAMVRHLGQALDVAADFVPLRRREVIAELARVMPAVGEDRLRRVWQALFGGANPPMDEIVQLQLNQTS